MTTGISKVILPILMEAVFCFGFVGLLMMKDIGPKQQICKVVEIRPGVDWGHIFLSIPQCETDIALRVLTGYVAFDNVMASISDLRIFPDVTTHGLIVSFKTPNGYWRKTQ